MNSAAPDLPPEVLDAMRRGELIQAIKLLRASRGIGLREAKAMVDALQRTGTASGAMAATAPTFHAHGALPASVTQALRVGNKLEAIKRLREETGIGLKEAKDAVDAAESSQPARPGALSPGEVPRGRSSMLGWAILASLLAIAWWWWRWSPG